MVAPPLDEEVLQKLRAITEQAFARAKEAKDVELMEECIKLIVLIDRKLERLILSPAHP